MSRHQQNEPARRGFNNWAGATAVVPGLASQASRTMPYWRIALCFPAVGFGAGVITPAATAALMAGVDKARAGVAAGVLNASRQTGSAFGVAIFGALISAIQPLDMGVRVAVYLAIGLSLVAALVWGIALAVATRYAGSDAW